MKKIQALLIGSLILNVALFATLGVNHKKTPEPLTHSGGISAVAAPKPLEKNNEAQETAGPSGESRPFNPAQASRPSSPETAPYTVANPPASATVSTHSARNAGSVPASSAPSTAAAPSASVAPLPAAGSAAPILSSPVAISIPSGPGNSITYRGQQAAITASRAATDSAPASLDASVTPATEQSPSSSTTQAGTSPGAVSGSSMPFDDQLFRTKWGWEAYDQARRAASLAASAAATPSQ